MAAEYSNPAYIRDGSNDLNPSSAKYKVSDRGDTDLQGSRHAQRGGGCKVLLIVVIVILLIIVTGLVTAIITWKVTQDRYNKRSSENTASTATTTSTTSYNDIYVGTTPTATASAATTATSTTTTTPTSTTTATPTTGSPPWMNVLHIIADDHRMELGTYLQYRPEVYRYIQTPNLDAFAETGTKFLNAFVNAPYCNPSRASFLTSRRPETTRVADVSDLPTYFRPLCNVTTLPGYLRSIGYETRGAGKIFHTLPWINATGDDNPFSWSQPVYQPPNFADYFQDHRFLPMPCNFVVNNSAVTSEDNIVNETLRTMAELAAMNKPFYLGVGFYRPHLPFWAKQKTFDMYPESSVALPPPPYFSPYVTQNEPDVAWLGGAELLQYTDITNYLITNGIVDRSMIRNFQIPYNYSIPNPTITSLRRAYYAAVTEMDKQVGQVLKALTDHGLDKNTIVIYHGDHGFLLGEHGGWTKFQASDLVNRAPLIIRVPGMKQNRVVSSVVEFVDLFPTLVELLGQPSLQTCPQQNSASVPLCTEGMSFRELMVKDEVGSQWQDEDAGDWSKPSFTMFYFTLGTNHPYMFYSLRNDQYRYVRYMNFTADTREIHWNEVLGEMLFDYSADPYENINFSDDPAYAATKIKLAGILAGGWHSYLR